jgi:hypothetical protein
MRGSRVSAIVWHTHGLILSFDNDMDLVMGYATQLSPVFRINEDYDRKPIDRWSRPEAEQGLRSSDVVSSVAFRIGELRIGFRRGWTLRTLSTDPTCPAYININGKTLWDNSGAHPVDGFRIEKLILPPPPAVWPDSDDINDIPWPEPGDTRLG